MATTEPVFSTSHENGWPKAEELPQDKSDSAPLQPPQAELDPAHEQNDEDPTPSHDENEQESQSDEMSDNYRSDLHFLAGLLGTEPVEEPKHIQVGENYQCNVDAVLEQSKLDQREEELAKAGELVWDPTRLSESQVDDYVNSVRLPLEGEAPFTFYSFNTEEPLPYDPTQVASLQMILQTLHECNYNTDTAKAQIVQQNHPYWHPKRPNIANWTKDEIETFETGFRQFFKNFGKIAEMLKSKSYFEIVEFYFYWKHVQILPRPPSTLTAALRLRPRINYIDAERKRKRDLGDEPDALDDYFAVAMYGTDASSLDEDSSNPPVENERHIDTSMLPDAHPAADSFPVDGATAITPAGNESHSSPTSASPKALHQLDVDVDMVLSEAAVPTSHPRAVLDALPNDQIEPNGHHHLIEEGLMPAAKRRKIELVDGDIDANPDL